MDTNTLYIGATALAGVVWAIRLEGRVNGHDNKFVDQDKAADKQAEIESERNQDLKDRLVRIETKLDRLPNAIANA